MSKLSKITAAKNMDWQQVVMNGGPPCFHLEDDCFCGRAQRWDGHQPWFQKSKDRTLPPLHEFVSLADLLEQLHQP